eukprot:65530-Rhodomonas_salina.2
MLDEFVISPYPEKGRKVSTLSYTIPTTDNFVQKRINQLQYMENIVKFEEDVKKMILKIHRTTGCAIQEPMGRNNNNHTMPKKNVVFKKKQNANIKTTILTKDEEEEKFKELRMQVLRQKAIDMAAEKIRETTKKKRKKKQEEKQLTQKEIDESLSENNIRKILAELVNENIASEIMSQAQTMRKHTNNQHEKI